MSSAASQQPIHVIAADVGGTKTSFIVFESPAQIEAPPQKQRFINRDYGSFREVLAAFLETLPEGRYALCVGLAGPVEDNRVELTNIDWTVNGAELQRAFGLDAVWLLNDLRAAAEGIGHLKDEDVMTLLEGEAEADGTVAIVSPGTGLGEAYVTYEGGKARAHPTEGGHTDFAPRTAEQTRLLAYLAEQMEQVSVEDVCSGIGIRNVYAFLQTEGGGAESEEHAEELRQSEDLPATLFSHALAEDSQCSLCGEALRIFLEILGAEAGNLALKVGATGGVYVGGGIPPKIKRAFESEVFAKYFISKGRQKDYMEQIPVRLVLNSQLPLIGAAHYAFEQLNTEE